MVLTNFSVILKVNCLEYVFSINQFRDAISSPILQFFRYTESTTQSGNQPPILEESTQCCPIYYTCLSIRTWLFQWTCPSDLIPLFYLVDLLAMTSLRDQIFASIRNKFPKYTISPKTRINAQILPECR